MGRALYAIWPYSGLAFLFCFLRSWKFENGTAESNFWVYWAAGFLIVWILSLLFYRGP